MRFLILTPLLAIIAIACSDAYAATVSSAPSPRIEDVTTNGRLVPPVESIILRNQIGFAFPDAPEVPTGPIDPALQAALDDIFNGAEARVDRAALESIAGASDARAAWPLVDLLRFLAQSETRNVVVAGFEQLTGASLDADPIAARSSWQSASDHLFAWNLPAVPDYDRWKGQLLTIIEPRWQPFFDDAAADIDWRFVSWGGVLMDDRPFGDSDPCPLGCIPALDDPGVTGASAGDWYPDGSLVFGVTVNGESRAYPKHIMEIHEMVNDGLGGRRLGIPYCTLCGSAQAYFTDDVPDGVAMPVLRTSGLLNRSNKVMFDLETFSVFDTFTGAAISGPLREAGVELAEASVVTSTWGDWKAAHPDTTIIAQNGGIGRKYPLDPLRGRDDNGPIFPIGDVDGRLHAQAKVLGVITDDGTPIAFDVADARADLAAGRAVSALGIVVVADGSGVRANREDGTEIAAHEAFWFAWSQFHPDTSVWATP
jgi:hypothetical protein